MLGPQKAIRTLKADPTLDISFGMAISMGILLGLSMAIKSTFGFGFLGGGVMQFISNIGIGVMATLLGLLLFSELLKWTSGLFQKEPSILFRAITTYSFLPLIALNLAIVILPKGDGFFILGLISFLWTFCLMTMMVEAYKQIGYLKAGIAVLIAIGISLIPYVLYFLMISSIGN